MARKPRKPPDEKTVIFESDFSLEPDAPRIFTATERELILADMAYLKQKEIESGDWAKWEKSQKSLGYNSPAGAERYRGIGLRRYPYVNVTISAGPISLERFCEAVGREPHTDELDRANCAAQGTIGHWSCGWCAACDKPRSVCGHMWT